MAIDQFTPPEAILGQQEIDSSDTFVDAQSLLSREEIEELAGLNRKQYNSMDGLAGEELKRRNFLEAKRKGEFLEPLSPEERTKMLELQRLQANGDAWSGEDANALALLTQRYEVNKKNQ